MKLVNEKYQSIIRTLQKTPEIILPLIKEVPEENLKRRPEPGKWSVHEHVCHLAEVHDLFFKRLDLMLNEENPVIKPYLPDKDFDEDALLKLDFEECLRRFISDREKLIERIRNLTEEEWKKTAAHDEYSHYSVFIMLRHVAFHDMLHAYRIEEILLKKDWK